MHAPVWRDPRIGQRELEGEGLPAEGARLVQSGGPLDDDRLVALALLEDVASLRLRAPRAGTREEGGGEGGGEGEGEGEGTR